MAGATGAVGRIRDLTRPTELLPAAGAIVLVVQDHEAQLAVLVGLT